MKARWLAMMAFFVMPTLVGRGADARDWAAILAGLGSGDFAKREAAQAELAKVPAAELPALVELLDKQADFEVVSRLNARLAEMAWERVVHEAAAPMRVEAHVKGRVVDTAGKPLADFPVTVGLPLVDEELAEVWTDAEGRFDAGVPFADVVYRVGSLPSPGLTSRVILPEGGGEMGDMAHLPMEYTAYTGKVMEGDKPVAGQEVVIYQDARGARSHVHPATAKTGTDGTFSCAVAGRPVMNSLLAIVRHGDMAVPLETPRGAGPMVLNLVKAATVQGVVRESGTNKPLAHVHVSIGHTLGGASWTLDTQSDETGHYQITGVPPEPSVRGVEYFVMAEAAGWNVPGQPVARLEAGGGATVDIAMDRAAVIMGRVVDSQGKPVAGALVGVEPKSRLGFPEARDPWAHVETDAQGYYALAAPRTIENSVQQVVGEAPGGQMITQVKTTVRELELAVYSAKAGLTRVALAPLKSGAVARKDVTLAGAVRVRGTVSDEKGRPLNEAACSVEGFHESALLPGADGRFDLGWVPVDGTGGMPAVLVMAPRLQRVTAEEYELRCNTFDFYDLRKPLARVTRLEELPALYLHQRVPVKAAAGENAELKIALQSTQALEFSGIVVDAQGGPVPKAAVLLLTGEATADTWLSSETLHDLTGKSLTNGPPDVILGGIMTGTDGRWRILAVRDDGTGAAANGRALDWSTYAVGAYFGDQRAISDAQMGRESGLKKGFVGGINVPRDTGRQEITIRLGK